MGTSEHSYRGVFDREKEVSWGIRKQLHLCVFWLQTEHRWQNGVSKRQPDPTAGLTWVHEWCVSHFSGFLFFQPLLAPSSTNHQLLAGWPPSFGIHFQLCSFPTPSFPITTVQFHLASHTTTLPVVPACFPSHYLNRALLLLLTSDCAASQRRVCLLHCAKPFHITTDSSNTFSN